MEADSLQVTDMENATLVITVSPLGPEIKEMKGYYQTYWYFNEVYLYLLPLYCVHDFYASSKNVQYKITIYLCREIPENLQKSPRSSTWVLVKVGTKAQVLFPSSSIPYKSILGEQNWHSHVRIESTSTSGKLQKSPCRHVIFFHLCFSPYMETKVQAAWELGKILNFDNLIWEVLSSQCRKRS